jgi:pyridoxine kinase
VNVLSIQSWVAYGHVGNAAAVFPLQRLGAEVWAIQTVQFSNHTGYGDWTGRVFDAADITALVDGIEARAVLSRCDAVLSGYMGSPETGAAILGAARRVRAANPRALWCCDPVIGDVGRGVFVRPGIAELLRDQAVPDADLLTPNHFELGMLAGLACPTLTEAKQAARAVQARMRQDGPRALLVTSLATDETPAGELDILTLDRDGAAHLVRTPRLPIAANGAGDLIAGLFLLHFMRFGSAAPAAALAVSSVHAVLRATRDAGSAELLLVAAQDEFVRPSVWFEPVSC